MKFFKSLMVSTIVISSLSTGILSVKASDTENETSQQELTSLQGDFTSLPLNTTDLNTKDAPISYVVAGPPIGSSLTNTIYLSNSDLGLYSGGATASSALISKKIKQKLIATLGLKLTGAVGNVGMVVAAVNQATGGKGFKITTRLTYTMVRENFFEAPKYAYVTQITGVSRY